MDTSRVHPHGHDTVEAHYSGLERLECPACYRGLVYIGHLVEDSEAGGEEVEIFETVPCRKCNAGESR